MKHYGSITDLSGYDLPQVDCIIGGSPCQDLSVAGKRAGLQGARSGLYMEQIRVIKEMREYGKLFGGPVEPRYMVWENVPGAFSSNKGKDFAAVLEEAIRIEEPQAPDVPVPANGWPTAGCISDVHGKWSVAWRVLDAQFWGVPQRRRRIALVTDFGGITAPEILFERESLCGDSAPCGEAGQGTAGGTESCADSAVCIPINDKATRYQGGGDTRNSDGAGNGLGVGKDGDPAPTMTAGDRHVVYAFDSMASNAMKSANPHSGCREVEVAKTLDTSDQNPSKNQGGVAVVSGFDWTAYGKCGADIGLSEESTPALTTTKVPAVCSSFNHKAGAKANGIGYGEEVTPTLKAEQTTAVYDARGNGDGVTCPTITGDHNGYVSDYTCIACNQTHVFKEHSFANYDEGVGTLRSTGGTVGQGSESLVVGALCAHDYRGVDQQYAEQGKLVAQHQTVRRLTPLECERLQGYPDYWTDVPTQGALSDGDTAFWRTVWDKWCDINEVKHHSDKQIATWLSKPPSDSARYKALGNSIALPQWHWICARMSHYLGDAPTLGSLFDGIGGFPLVWQRINGDGTAVWSSEIEPSAIRVTRHHFGGD